MSQATFGKRATAPGAKAAAPQPRAPKPAPSPTPPAFVAEPSATRLGGPLGDVIDQIANPPEAPVEKLWWSYFKACVTAFLTTEFEGGRHARRVEKLSNPPLDPAQLETSR